MSRYLVLFIFIIACIGNGIAQSISWIVSDVLERVAEDVEEDSLPKTIGLCADNIPFNPYHITISDIFDREGVVFSASTANKKFISEKEIPEVFYNGFQAFFLNVQLLSNQLTISVERRNIRMNKIGFFEYEMLDYKTYLYEYSCESESWEYRLCVDIYPQFQMNRIISEMPIPLPLKFADNLSRYVVFATKKFCR